ncbi:ABC transporter permease [bacterium]|nr:ABC transporter permease [bacterium]MBU1984169.1 ABC transporter permease [bacterium]
MRRVLHLVAKDFRIFLTDPVAVALGFVVPIVMITIFGLVFGRERGGMSELVVLAVNQDRGPAGARLLRALDETDEIRIIETVRGDTTALDSAKARERVERGRSSVAVIVPRDFSDGLREGEVRLTLFYDPQNPIAAGVTQGLLQKQVFTSFPGMMPTGLSRQSFGADSLTKLGFDRDLVAAIERNFGVKLPDSVPFYKTMPKEWLLGTDPDTAAVSSADSAQSGFSRIFDDMMKIESEAVVGKNIVNPGIAQSVAGPAVMFLLFAVGAIAASLLREMHYGTAARLLVSGVRAGELLVSKGFYALLLGCGQLVVMMIYGWLVFRLDIFGNFGPLILMIICTSAAMSAVGLFIAAISRTEEQAYGFQVIVILGMSAIGGAMFPSFMIPAAVRTIAQATPVHWAMQGFLDVFWRLQPVSGIALECGILLGMTATLTIIAVSLFYKRLAIELG